MTPDQVIGKLRAWHNARVNERDTFYNDMADAVEALQAECERLKKQLQEPPCECCDDEVHITAELEADCKRLKELLAADTANGVVNDYQTTRIAELEAENERLKTENAELKCRSEAFAMSEDLAPKVSALKAELAALREQQVRYVEIDANGPEIIDTKKYRVFTDGAWYVVEVPPRTPENTVPLKKGPSVVDRVARMIFSCANALGIGVAPHHREFIAEQLNAAGLLTEEPNT